MVKQIRCLIMTTAILLSATCANALDLEVNANTSVAEGTLSLTRQNLTAGISVLHDRDDYTIGGASLTFGSDRFVDGLRLGIGFKGVIGSVEKTPEDADLSAVGFLFSTRYDIPAFEIYYGLPVDLELLADICFAPSSMNFGESDQYTEIETGIGLHVLGNKRGTLIVGYRTMEIRFDESLNNFWMTDNAVFLGYRFRF